MPLEVRGRTWYTLPRLPLLVVLKNEDVSIVADLLSAYFTASMRSHPEANLFHCREAKTPL